MTSKFFVVADRSGVLSVKPAEEVVARNVEAYLAIDTPIAQIVVAQADDEAQANRFAELLRGQVAA